MQVESKSPDAKQKNIGLGEHREGQMSIAERRRLRKEKELRAKENAKHIVPGREINSWTLRVHFFIMAAIAGFAGWALNFLLFKSDVGLLERHSLSLLVSFVLLGVLIRAWLHFIGAAPTEEERPPSFVEEVEASLPLDVRMQLMEYRVKSNLQVAESVASFFSSPGSAVSRPSVSNLFPDSDDFTLDEGLPLFVILFISALLLSILFFLGFAILEAPILLAEIAAEASVAAAAATRGSVAVGSWETSWMWTFLRKIGPRFLILSALIFLVDFILIFFVPSAQSWQPIFQALSSLAQ